MRLCGFPADSAVMLLTLIHLIGWGVGYCYLTEFVWVGGAKNSLGYPRRSTYNFV